MDKPLDRALVWFRRDLRTSDQAALHHALQAARQVYCAFVFDTTMLDPLPRADRRVEFIHACLVGLHDELRALAAPHGVEHAGLVVRHGPALRELPHLAAELHVQAVYANHDDDPAARERDARMRGALADLGIAFHTSKDHVVFERSEVLNAGGTPYRVFTPYKHHWLAKLDDAQLGAYPVARHAGALARLPPALRGGVPSLASIGFQPTNLAQLALPAGTAGARTLLADFRRRIDRYHTSRDFPAVKGPSYLGAHLRFGTVSIRELVRDAWARSKKGSRGAAVWLSELAWREFYQQILHHHPHVVGHAFRADCDTIAWHRGKQADAWFAAWCAGRTGYPLVDAAMAQLNQTGYLHNRLRMLAASFLVKDLGIDWRRGEAYFATHLNDFELASNNGGWQWVASTGCDAQPYFRIFHPVSQSERFDADGKFIRRYLPVLAKLPNRLIHAPWLARPEDLQAASIRLGRDYPAPLVQHDEARRTTLQRYAAAQGRR